MTIQIGLIGDFNPEVKAHFAIPKALNLAGRATNCEAKATWIATDEIAQNSERLSAFDALWYVPASP